MTLKAANPGRNYSVDTLAGVNDQDKPYVLEGRHRAIGASQGAQIDPQLGGVPSAPGYLDYEYTPSPQSGGVPVKGLTIDQKDPDSLVMMQERPADKNMEFPDTFFG